MQTRWHVDDLAGRLLSTQGDKWCHLSLPAIAEEDDALGREPGTYLWDDDPKYADGQWLRDRQAECEANGMERDWSSLFQQQPVLQSGNLFKVDCIPIVTSCDNLEATRPVRAWDLAGTTKKTSDWSVGVRMHRLSNNRLVISDVVRLKGTPEMVEKAILATARRDGWNTKIAIARDPGQAGLAQEAYLVRQLMGYTVVSSPESGDKVLRASPLASQANVGNLSILDTGGDWVRPLLNELRDFPAGKFDDQVDACSRAFATLGGSGANLALWEALAGDGGPLVRPVPTPTPLPAAEPHQAPLSPQLNRFGTM